MASKGKRGLNNFEEDYVYRVLRKDESSEKDLKCKDNNARVPLNDHIEKGSRQKSQYISTTASMKKANSFAYHSVQRDHKPVEIVKIDVNWIKSNKPGLANQAYDLRLEKNRDKFLTAPKQKEQASRMKEVCFPHKIPKEAVSSVRTVGGKKK